MIAVLRKRGGWKNLWNQYTWRLDFFFGGWNFSKSVSVTSCLLERWEYKYTCLQMPPKKPNPTHNPKTRKFMFKVGFGLAHIWMGVSQPETQDPPITGFVCRYNFFSGFCYLYLSTCNSALQCWNSLWKIFLSKKYDLFTFFQFILRLVQQTLIRVL